MLKTSLALMVGLGLFATDALAQYQGRSGNKHEQDACSRDVNRYCRKVIDQGDMVILNCLQQNRQRLTKACNKVLTDNGQ